MVSPAQKTTQKNALQYCFVGVPTAGIARGHSTPSVSHTYAHSNVSAPISIEAYWLCHLYVVQTGKQAQSFRDYNTLPRFLWYEDRAQ